jgi:small-conductance mechanosensitive channel/CRP-like cAMP-binding protein
MFGMIQSTAAPAMLALTVAALVVIHARSARVRLIVEGALLLALGECFSLWQVTPFGFGGGLAQRPDAGWLRALAVIWWLMGARVVASVMVIALGRSARSRQARLLSDLVAGAIYLTAFLVVLNSVLGLQLKGLLATSGIVAVVLGLASQNALADVFSGIAVGLDQPFHVGDRVSIGDHAEGVVVQINWRSIRVQTDGEDIALIPNSVVAKAQIVNRSVPTPRRAASVDIPIQSPARAETLIALLQQAILLSPAVLETPAPGISLKYLGRSATTFSISYFVAASPDMSPARSQLLRQVRRVLRHAGMGEGAPSTPASLLSGLTLFESLTAEQIARLESTLIPHRVDPGALLFEQGGAGASIYIVRSGVLEFGRKDGGSWTAYGRIGPGDYLGEVSMMSGQPHPVSATALSASEVLELPKPALETLLIEDPALADALRRAVGRGQARLDKDAAARNAPGLDGSGNALGQIWEFLRRRLA